MPDGEPTDDELIAAFNAGDDIAARLLYDRHKLFVHRVAYRFTGHAEDALEALQDAFAYFFEQLPRLRLTASVRTFLYPVTKHRALATRRKNRQRVGNATVPDKAAPLADPDVHEKHAELRAAIGTLPERQREIMEMRYWFGMTGSEIAFSLGISEGTIKAAHHCAIQALRADPHLRRYFDEE
jgi:RNA polymerase sigma-70 factor (ECF subfamily)